MIEDEELRILNLIKKGSIKPSSVKENIKQIMWNKVAIIRNEKNLNEGLKELLNIKNNTLKELDVKESKQYNNELQEAIEIINMVEIAILTVKSAILRRESRGAHYREDFPETKDNWKKVLL